MDIKVILLLLLCTTVCNAKEFGPNQTVAQEVATLLANDEDVKMRQNIHATSLKTQLYNIDIATGFAERGIKDSWLRSFFYKDTDGFIYLCPKKTPKLHALVEKVAQACNVPTPPVFLAEDKEMFNAMATSFSPNISMVILGQKLVEEMTDDELMAVLAHELGHIKFNHIPKKIIMHLALAGGSVALASYIAYKLHNVGPQALLETIGIFSATGVAIEAISVYVTYRHECQADDKAIRAVGAQPFVDSMETMKKYIMNELAIFDKEHAYCVSQLKKLEELNPEKAADIKDTLDAIKNRMYSWVQEHLDTDGNHPALNKRIEHGKEQLAAGAQPA